MAVLFSKAEHMTQQASTPRVYLADLTIQPTKVAVCVRVMRKWSFNGNEPGAAIRYIGLVLADEKGDSIYAQILQGQVHRLGSLLQLHSTYIISKFTVRTSRTGYIPFERRLMIEFNAYSTIKEVRDPPNTFPAYIYHITPFSNINPFGTAATKLIDLLGILTTVENPRSLPLPKKERVATIREVTIRNESNEEIKITLWDERAIEFSLPTASTSESTHSIVVLFVGCQPASLNNITQAYGGNACQWYFNPEIKEAQALYNRLKLSPVTIHTPPPELTGGHELIQPIMIEHKTLDELNSIDPYEIPKIGYKCTVTITNIHEIPRWWYVGCAKCGKAPEVETVPFLCRCGWKDSTPLYKLSFQAKDDTGEARFFGYDEVSRRIIRRNIDFMLRQSRQAAGLPQHFKDLISRKYTFVVGVTNSSFQDPRFRTYLVKTVSIDYHEKAFIANQHLLVQTPSQTAASTSSGSLALQITDPNALNNQVETVTQITTLTNASTPPPAIVTDDTPTKDATNQAQHIRSLQPRTLFPPAACTEKTDTVSEQIETANALSAHTVPELQAPGTQDDSGSFPPSAKNKKNSIEQKDSHIEKGSHIDDSTKDEHAATTAIAPQHGIKRSTPADSGCKTRDDICKATPSKSHK